MSLLVQFEPASDTLDWKVGTHGIRIEYKQHGKRLNAVYLPEVAAEQGWNNIETLDHLMRKGGFEGPIYDSDRNAVSIERFQSSKILMTFNVSPLRFHHNYLNVLIFRSIVLSRKIKALSFHLYINFYSLKLSVQLV